MIRTHGLAFAYAGGPTLAFPDLEVPQGGVLLLKGPSGSGKSTWLALAAGLVQAKSGVLEVAGRVLASEVPSMARPSRSALDSWRAASIGFLPQKLHLSPALTVHDNLAMAQWAAGRVEDRRQIVQALAALGVDDLAQRKPAQLSGGQAQRVALARAVLLQPKLILADEPTASLDDAAAAVAAQLLQKSAQTSGATLVIASHDARVLQFFAAEENTVVLALESKPSGSAS
jgi:putative ABC transport system ATP-binding protein